MISFTDMVVVFGMFFLRVGVPLLIVIAVGYGLKQLDRRWEAEARAHQAKTADAQPEAPELPVRKPAKQPTPQPLPFIPPPVTEKDQRMGLFAQPGVLAAGKHCWDEHGCTDSKRATCAASSHLDQACWQARFNAEGHVPEECVGCDIFQRYPTM
jgi:hypothetical protein